MRSFLLSLFLLGLLSNTEANARIRHITGHEANGGQVGFFWSQIESIRERKITVVLDKGCYSSCTLYLALLPDGLLCATPGATLYFHQYVAAEYEAYGGVIDSYRRARPLSLPTWLKIWRTYPANVRRVILRHSPRGLFTTDTYIGIAAKEFGVPTCGLVQ